MVDYKFLSLLCLIPVAGLATGIAWTACKQLVNLYSRVRYWLHYRKHKVTYKQKIEPKL
jgi:hypothetical protein